MTRRTKTVKPVGWTYDPYRDQYGWWCTISLDGDPVHAVDRPMETADAARWQAIDWVETNGHRISN